MQTPHPHNAHQPRRSPGAGWRAALATMIGVDPSALPDTGPPILRIDDMRAAYAWAGWRVSVRDRSCLTTSIDTPVRSAQVK